MIVQVLNNTLFCSRDHMSSLSKFVIEQKRSSFAIFKPLIQNVCSDISVGCGTDTQEVTGYNTSFFLIFR